LTLAKGIDYVIGVDTHKDSHSAALVNSTGGVITALDVTASEAGYRRLLVLANRQAVGRRALAVEGTGSFGAGLATFLAQHGERVLEIERPRRARQEPGKSDQLDAIAAAREALADDKVATPRTHPWTRCEAPGMRLPRSCRFPRARRSWFCSTVGPPDGRRSGASPSAEHRWDLRAIPTSSQPRAIACRAPT